MGVREKVTIVFLIVLFLQITARHCMPKNINTVPFRSSKRLKNILQSSTSNNILEQYYKKSNILETNKGNVKTDRDSSKLSKSILNELIKSIKSKHSDPTEINKESPNSLLKPFATTPQPYCFKEIGTFPEVEYPMFVTDTWTPNYWKKLPDSQQNFITNSGSYITSKTETEQTKYIKPSNKAIEKAVKALIKYKEKTDNLNTEPIDITKTEPDSSTCPVNPPDQCLPSDEPKIKNTTIPTTKLSLNEYFDPHPVYGTYTSANYDTSKDHLISSSPLVPGENTQLIDPPIATLVHPKNFNQLNYQTEMASEHIQKSTPITAMPPLPSSSSISSKTESSSYADMTSTINQRTQLILPVKGIINQSSSDQTTTLIGSDESIPLPIINSDKLVDTPIAGFVKPTDSLTASSGDVIHPPISSKEELVPTLVTNNLSPAGFINSETADIIEPAQPIAPMTSMNNIPNKLIGDLANDVIEPAKTLDAQAIDVENMPVVDIVDNNESIVTPNKEAPSDDFGNSVGALDTSNIGTVTNTASGSDTGITNLQAADTVKSPGSMSLPNDSIVDPKDFPGTPAGFLEPIGTLATTMLIKNILGENGISPAGTLIPSATGINNPTELLYAIEEPTGPLTELDTGSSSVLLPTPTSRGASFAGITDNSNPVTKIDNPDMFNSLIPFEESSSLLTKPIPSQKSSSNSMLSSADTMTSVLSSSSTSYSESNSDLGMNDYEFATVPPFLISYDTSENMPDPDDSSTKFSPGDVDYILV